MAGRRPLVRKLPVRTRRGVSQRDLRMDNVRGLMILLVVIGHFLLPLYQTRLVTNLFYTIYIFHMPLFVLCSGFFAKGVYDGRRFRTDRLVQLLWLYLVYECIVYVTEGIAYGFGPPDFLHESGAPWYLISLSAWYLAVPVMYRFRYYPDYLVALLVLLVLLLFGRYFVHPMDFLSLDRTLAFSPFFFIGYFTTQDMLDGYLRSGLRRRMAVLAAVLLLFVFLSAKDLLLPYNLVVYGCDYRRYAAHQHGYIWLINLVWYVAAFVICVGVTGMVVNRRIRFITRLGENTLQIYVLHRPIRDLLEAAGFFERVNAHDKLHVLGVVLFASALTLFLGNGYFSLAFRWLRNVPGALLAAAGPGGRKDMEKSGGSLPRR